MKSRADVEDVLEELGRDWPADESIADGVLRGLDSIPPRPAEKPARGRGRGVRRVLLVTASVAVCAALWWASPSHSTVYARTRDAILRARSFQMTTRWFGEGDGRDRLTLTMAYERGVGFREDWPDEMSLGNHEGAWHYRKGAKLAVKTKGPGISRMVDRFLDHELGRIFADVSYERYAAQDQVIDGQPCEAWLITNPRYKVVGDVDADRQRSIVLKDKQSRILRTIIEVRPLEQWIARADIELKYDVPLDAALFQADFPEDVRVVDADSAFEHFIDLEHAIYLEDRRGLWYAIHHAERTENGGLFFVTSVRGTDSTLKKYPLTERPLTRGKIFIDGPADQYPGSQDPGIRGNVIQLAAVDHQGINVSWWILIPVVPTDRTPFDAGEGKVKVPAGFRPLGPFGRENFTDADGVTHPAKWEIQLPLPKAASLSSLDAISKRVYGDLESFEGVPFRFPNMRYRGLMLVNFNDFDKTTPAEFAEAVADEVQWWKNGAPMEDPRARELRGVPAPAK